MTQGGESNIMHVYENEYVEIDGDLLATSASYRALMERVTVSW